MKSILIRSIFLLLLALLQASFLNLFPNSIGALPFILFSYAVSRAYLSGFHSAIPSVLVFGTFSDALTSERIGMGILFAIGVTYTVSFFSKRFTLEHRLLTAIVSGVLVGAVAFLFPFVSSVLLSFLDGDLTFASFESFTLARMATALGIGLVLFPVVHFVTRRFEERMQYIESGEKIPW